MSKSEEEIRIKQISECLKVIRKRVEVLLARVPLMRLNSIDEISSEEDKRLFLLTAAAVIVDFEAVEEVKAHLSSMISPEKDGEIFEWRDKKLVPIHNKMRELVRGTSEVPDHGNRIQAAFATLLKFMKYMKDHHDFELDERGGYLLMWERIIDWPYFQPDAWDRNERALFPVVTKRDVGKIPEHIRERVAEIYRSFVFGNWMAAIALSRCLLEYAIVEQRDVLGIEVYTAKKKWVRRLSELIEDVGKIRPKLLPHMEQIKGAGDSVMHPPEENAEPKLLGEDDAKKCFVNIREIIRDLYGK